VSKLEAKYQTETDANGLFVFVVTGRCTEDERSDIEDNCTRRFEMVTLPNASGAILKSMDGSQPRVLSVEPPTFGGASYDCVKVEGRCWPCAYQQADGPYSGHTILYYLIRYQQVGGTS